MKNVWRGILNKIGKKRCSIQIDTTQDSGVVDQASVVLRYVKDKEIQEQLFAVVPV